MIKASAALASSILVLLYFSTSEDSEKSRDDNAELRENIKRLEIEMSRYEKRLEIATEERERLISGLTLAKSMKEIVESDLRRTTEDLKTREEECDCLQKQIQVLTDMENRKQEQRYVEIDEIKELRREVNISREVRMDIEADMKLAKQELKDISERELILVRTVETLKEREAELSTEFTLSKERERSLEELIKTLQASLHAVVGKEEGIRDLRNKFSDTKDNVPANITQKMKALYDKVEKYAAERSNLQDRLGRMVEEKESLMQRVKMLEGQIKKLKSTQSSNPQTVLLERV